jgi:cystathionine beta-lyase/cystathionine gamma-synthase
MRPKTKMVWIETPTNPTLKVVDIAAVSEAAHAERDDVIVCVDNTFASPYLQQPLTLGADLVLHSATKYLGGHSDVVGGVLVGREEALHERLAFLQNSAGAIPGPFDSWLVLRGLKTLALRMAQHSTAGLTVARWLDDHPAVESVIYPGLSSHPQHEVAKRQMPNGHGGMVSFLVSDVEHARSIVSRTRLFTLAESLGGVESLIEVPADMTHLSTADSSLAVPPGLVRLSVGIEAVDDLLADLDRAVG